MKEKKPHSTPPDIPGLPQTWDELMDCVKEGEEEFERGEAIPWDVATCCDTIELVAGTVSES